MDRPVSLAFALVGDCAIHKCKYQVGIELDSPIVVGNRSIELAHAAVRVAAIVQWGGIGRIECDSLVEVFDRPVVLELALVGAPASIVGSGGFGIERDCLVKIHDGAIEILLVQMDRASIQIGGRQVLGLLPGLDHRGATRELLLDRHVAAGQARELSVRLLGVGGPYLQDRGCQEREGCAQAYERRS